MLAVGAEDVDPVGICAVADDAAVGQPDGGGVGGAAADDGGAGPVLGEDVDAVGAGEHGDVAGRAEIAAGRVDVVGIHRRVLRSAGQHLRLGAQQDPVIDAQGAGDVFIQVDDLAGGLVRRPPGGGQRRRVAHARDHLAFCIGTTRRERKGQCGEACEGDGHANAGVAAHA